MHRWQFQRVIRVLLPSLLLLVLWCLALLWRKQSGLGLAFDADEVYVDQGVAGHLVHGGTFGLTPGHPAPAARHALWRLLLAGVTLLTGQTTAAVYLLGAACTLATLFASLRWVRRLFPFPTFINFSAVLLVLAPGWVMDGLSGRASCLGTPLVTLAFMTHWEGWLKPGGALPLKAALWVGLAACVRLEYFLFWLLFCLHVMLLKLFGQHEGNDLYLVLRRAALGLAVILCCLLPVFVWNYSQIHVLWPPIPGAPLRLDHLLRQPLHEWGRTYLEALRADWATGFRLLYELPALHGRVERVLAWTGLALIFGLAVGHREERPATILVALMLLAPALLALAAPCLGWSGARAYLQPLGAVGVVCGSYVIFRVPFFVEQMYRKWKTGIPQSPGFHTWWLVAGTALMLLAVTRSGRQFREGNDRLRALLEARDATVQAVHETVAAGGLYLTDEPGWLLERETLRVGDLTGEFQPWLLACLDARGGWDPERLKAWLRQQQPVALVVWSPEFDFLAGLLPVEKVTLSGGPTAPLPRPAFWRVIPGAAP